MPRWSSVTISQSARIQLSEKARKKRHRLDRLGRYGPPRLPRTYAARIINRHSCFIYSWRLMSSSFASSWSAAAVISADAASLVWELALRILLLFYLTSQFWSRVLCLRLISSQHDDESTRSCIRTHSFGLIRYDALVCHTCSYLLNTGHTEHTMTRPTLCYSAADLWNF